MYVRRHTGTENTTAAGKFAQTLFNMGSSTKKRMVGASSIEDNLRYVQGVQEIIRLARDELQNGTDNSILIERQKNDLPKISGMNKESTLYKISKQLDTTLTERDTFKAIPQEQIAAIAAAEQEASLRLKKAREEGETAASQKSDPLANQKADLKIVELLEAREKEEKEMKRKSAEIPKSAEQIQREQIRARIAAEDERRGLKKPVVKTTEEPVRRPKPGS